MRGTWRRWWGTAAVAAALAVGAGFAAMERAEAQPRRAMRTVVVRSRSLLPGQTDDRYFSIPAGARTVAYRLQGGGPYPSAGIFGPGFRHFTIVGTRTYRDRRPVPGRWRVMFVGNAFTRGRTKLVVTPSR